jgi:hypothetical protein
VEFFRPEAGYTFKESRNAPNKNIPVVKLTIPKIKARKDFK